MDETLRRRLVGAAVLLAVAFGVASLLPDPRERPSADAGRAVTYDLRTGRPVEPLPERGFVHTPPPATELAQEPPHAKRPALKVDESLGEPQGGWFVQIGSFGSQGNARNVLQKLYGLGMPAVIQTVPVDGKLWYRVRVGPYRDEAAAMAALAAVRRNGYPLAKLVRPETGAARGRN